MTHDPLDILKNHRLLKGGASLWDGRSVTTEKAGHCCGMGGALPLKRRGIAVEWAERYLQMVLLANDGPVAALRALVAHIRVTLLHVRAQVRHAAEHGATSVLQAHSSDVTTRSNVT